MEIRGILKALERLWGVDPGAYEPFTDYTAWIERPQGFTVAEPGGVASGGGWALYLVRKEALDSLEAARRLAALLGAGSYSLQGLKDACSVSYQYIAIKNPRSTPSRVEAGRLRAWLVGRSRPLAPGAHGFNVFRLHVRLQGDPEAFCRAAHGLRWIPGYYGPQRFGVERSNTHYIGYLRLIGRLGGLVLEYGRRYPLEERAPQPPGSYERRAIEAVERRRSPLEASRFGPRRIHLEALQAYIFNRALSKLERRGLDPWMSTRRRAHLACPQGRVAAPAGRLPPPGKPSTPWQEVVLEVMEEEGLPPGLWASHATRGSWRPLAYPVCRISCRPTSDGAILVTALPAGAYATILLRRIAWVDWLRYSHCRS